ncbi:MAG: hypothetical protein VZQ83_10405 [Eubacterium sp.]|nr:hypothetical protein [Eubacterium sp.]
MALFSLIDVDGVFALSLAVEEVSVLKFGDGYQPSQERTVEEIIIPDGEKLYVSNQWRAKKPTDNFFSFKDIVNAMGWGKIV